jgi:hypothetical protein
MTINHIQWTPEFEDVQRMARFWSAAFGYSPQRAKNRLHLDFVADDEIATEVDRLIGLGATHADIGQTGDEPFVVLRDPEGNEFCVLVGEPQRRPGRTQL